MFFEQIKTPGLEHYSYLAGSQGEAFVIDPRYDIGIYLQIAARENLRITHILETHRNEDILSGAKRLGELTGAQVWRSRYEKLPYQYGSPVGEDDVFLFGKELMLTVLHTPGHTKGHLCYCLHVNRQPYMVFTGDTLFFGAVGRTDFYGQKELKKMTTLLHQSIYEKIAPLGQEVLVMPAHGHGSACGAGMDERPLSTVGYETRHSDAIPRQLDKFLQANARMHHKNPAFETMEQLNLQGSGAEGCAPPAVLTDIPPHAAVLDIRSQPAFVAGHLPGSLHVPAKLLSVYAGWFVQTTDPVVLMADGVTAEDLCLAACLLRRQGFDNLLGMVGRGYLRQYQAQGNALVPTPQVSAADYLAQAPADAVTLDVREQEELSPDDPLVNRLHIPYQQLKQRLAEVPAEKTLYVVCGSGERATVAAAFLQSARGLDGIVVAGGMAAIGAVQQKNAEGKAARGRKNSGPQSSQEKRTK